MHSDDFLNLIRREAERVMERRASGFRIGLVSSYDPVTHSVKLTLQPEGTETGWLPVATDGVGAGFGIYTGPTTNQAFIAYFHEGDLEAGVVIGRLPNDHDTPVSVQSGETVIKTPFGSFIELLQNGSVTIQDKGGAIVTLDGSGNVTALADSGQSIVMNAAGAIIMTDKGGASIECDGSGNIVLTGKAGQTIVMDSSGDIILTPAGAGLIKLGGGTASVAIARNNDTIVSSKVVATSTKVLSL